MPQQKEVVTDRLVSIIQTIQLRRGTGVLTVRRGEGPTLEEGMIVFANGQVSEAKVGRNKKGADAVNALSTWGRSLFSFVPANPQDNLLQFLVTPPPPPPVTDGNKSSSQSFTPISPLRRLSTPLTSEETPTMAIELSPGNPTQATVPHHLVSLETALRTIEQRGLTRSHRQLFLLINGQRPLAELIRLTGRSYNDIYGILQDLERASLIRIVSDPSPRY
jgi:hypothetical protein